MRDNKICPVRWFHKIRKPDGDLMLVIGVMKARHRRLGRILAGPEI
jgi:hypothetical protein